MKYYAEYTGAATYILYNEIELKKQINWLKNQGRSEEINNLNGMLCFDSLAKAKSHLKRALRGDRDEAIAALRELSKLT